MQGFPNWAYKCKKSRTLSGPALICKASDPINLCFVGVSLDAVDGTFLAAKWQPQGLATSNLFLDRICSRPQNSQWTHPGSIWRRFHVRLWREGNNVIGSAHYETLRGFHRHEVHHFEGAEDMVAELFKILGWKVSLGSIKLQDPEFERYNDGFCTEIQR